MPQKVAIGGVVGGRQAQSRHEYVFQLLPNQLGIRFFSLQRLWRLGFRRVCGPALPDTPALNGFHVGNPLWEIEILCAIERLLLDELDRG
jgi:hypothetical protein